MRTIQKVSLSLLISVVAFSGLAVFAFSGLFDVIESSFYSPRVQEHYRTILSESADTVQRYHRTNIERFSSVFEQESFARVFEANQSQSDIENRVNVLRQLRSEHGSFSHVWVIDRDGEQVHFSTRSEDFEEREGERVYRPIDEIDSEIASLALESGESADVASDVDGQYLVYRIPVNNDNGNSRGTALVYFGTRELAGRLVSAGVLDPGHDVVVMDGDGYVFNVPRDLRESVSEAVSSVWGSLSSGETARIDAGGGVALPFEESGSFRFAYFLPETELRLSRELESVILAGSFSTLFLATFLLLNIRQESSVVLSERVRRFQIRMLREYLERRDELDWEGKARELERLKPELTKKIKRGIGKVHRDEREELDELVERGWNEILDVIGGRRSYSTSNPDIQHLESMLKRVISSLGEAGPQALPATNSQEQQSASAPPAGRVDSGASGSEAGGPAGESVESADSGSEAVGELEEIEELQSEDEADDIAPLEALEQGEQLDSPDDTDEVKSLEALEEVEEIDAVDDAKKPEPPEQPDEVQELEPMEDTEQIGVLEEASETAQGDTDGEGAHVESPGDSDDAEEPAALEELDDAEEPAALEEFDDAEEPAALEEFEDAEEPAALEELDDAEEPAALEELDDAEEPAALEELDDAEEPAALEELDDAEEPAALEELDDAEEPAALEELDSAAGLAYKDAKEPEKDAVSYDPASGQEQDLEELDSLEPAEEAGDADGAQGPPTADETIVRGWPLGKAETKPDWQREGTKEPRAASLPTSDLAGAFMNVSIEEEIEAIADEESARLGSEVAAGEGRATVRVAGEGTEGEDVLGVEQGKIISTSVIRRIFSEGTIVSSGSGVFQIDESLFSETSQTRSGERSAVGPDGGADAGSLSVGRRREKSQDALFLGDVSVHRVSRSLSRHHATTSETALHGRSAGGVGGYQTARASGTRETEPGGAGARNSNISGVEEGGKPSLLGPDGVDFDRFLRGYRNNDAGIVRALVFFTRRVGAPVALILLPKADGYRGQYSLGLDEGVAKRINIPKESEFARKVLDGRRVFHFEAELSTLRDIRIELDPSAVSAFKRSLFIPIQFRQRNGYLILGLPVDGQAPEAVMEQVRDTIASS